MKPYKNPRPQLKTTHQITKTTPLKQFLIDHEDDDSTLFPLPLFPPLLNVFRGCPRLLYRRLHIPRDPVRVSLQRAIKSHGKWFRVLGTQAPHKHVEHSQSRGGRCILQQLPRCERARDCLGSSGLGRWWCRLSPHPPEGLRDPYPHRGNPNLRRHFLR